jgi:glycosyltransferase involved in cell wall biosynthesis
MDRLPSCGNLSRIALIGNFPPRLCGIATFTRDVYEALTALDDAPEVDVYAMNDPGADHAYPAAVTMAIGQNELADYQAVAHAINQSGADIVLVQHEYGIFGGPAGAHLLRLLDRVAAPVIVTLHTVLETPNPDQRAVVEALARRAAKLIVMADRGREMLMRIHGIPADRIAVVKHGVPDRPQLPTAELKPAFGFEGRDVLLTFGLLSPNKGIETVIRALPDIAARHPDALYVILGATHPHLVAHEGEAYRESLIALASELGVDGHVRFIDGFLDQEDLLDYLAVADIYVTPYLNEAQITSGTLSYAVALGKPVVSTPYWHASELLADGVGTLVGFGDSAGFASAINGLLDEPDRMADVGTRAYAIGRTMIWPRLAEAYSEICDAAIASRVTRLPAPYRTAADRPAVTLAAMERMSDGVGMLQHSIFSVPDRAHGYCLDDNARALMLMHRIEGDLAPRADALARTYASFVQSAWNGDNGRFRNFMAYDRRWLEDAGSEDSFGRALWALGVTAADARDAQLRRWAAHLFDQVAAQIHALGSPRTWAFALLGADAMLGAHPGHGLARRLVGELATRLHACLRQSRRDGWTWFESVLGYDNARMPEALLRAAIHLDDAEMRADALTALVWLDDIQTTAQGHFRAVGTDSFGREHAVPMPFDQQPLEAWAMIDAAVCADAATGDPRWATAALRAWGWYLGENDVGLPLGSVRDGECFDGLMNDRVNLNQGAESVLAFQFAVCAVSRMMARARRPDDGRDVAAS